MNTAYVRGLGGICWADFFARVDARDAVAARLVDLPSRLPTMRDRLGMVELPGAEPGSRCGKSILTVESFTAATWPSKGT